MATSPETKRSHRAQGKALSVAWEHVDWAIGQGLSVEDIFRQADLDPPLNPSLKAAVSALAQQWEQLRSGGAGSRSEAEREKLGRLNSLRGSRTPLTPIIEVVCAEAGIAQEEFFSFSRSRTVVDARREALTRALSMTTHRLPQIAAWLGLDRTTAIYHRGAAERTGRISDTEDVVRDLALSYVHAPTPEGLRAAAALVGDRLALRRPEREAGGLVDECLGSDAPR